MSFCNRWAKIWPKIQPGWATLGRLLGPFFQRWATLLVVRRQSRRSDEKQLKYSAVMHLLAVSSFQQTCQHVLNLKSPGGPFLMNVCVVEKLVPSYFWLSQILLRF